MNYRKIEVNENEAPILTQIAKWHNFTPKQWMPKYKPTNDDIEATITQINKTAKEDLFIAIAEDNQQQIQGFIWAYKQDKPQDSVMILSLYVTTQYRKCGVATKLKTLLEEWCKQKAVKSIQTTVHYTNNKMIELNKKLGYAPGMVYMTKKIE
ncbi:GNAT family N-acetyltransferase [Clostridium sp. 'deep sea']|uniref:GNAT family N-acetyltransferase n=1 Tax=Clostridium sp. 'deep sea' TaxID=2779445 RepID=UPI001896755F|nr:GNAT family N-acetyltransferase [Clostridium sp. 'deep sea']QOR36836.1 GNAT family N-acetyltransferase [Clostridium sp. 'deep sea']